MDLFELLMIVHVNDVLSCLAVVFFQLADAMQASDQGTMSLKSHGYHLACEYVDWY